MSFKPSILFHKENGGSVVLEVDSAALSTLTSDSSLELNFNYDQTDVDSSGFVRYPDKKYAILELKKIIEGMTINIPEPSQARTAESRSRRARRSIPENQPEPIMLARIGASEEEQSAMDKIRANVAKAKARGTSGVGFRPDLTASENAKGIVLHALDYLSTTAGKIIPEVNSGKYYIDFSLCFTGKNFSSINEVFQEFKLLNLYVFNKKFTHVSDLRTYIDSSNNEGFKFREIDNSLTGISTVDNIILNGVFKRFELGSFRVESSIYVPSVTILAEYVTHDGESYIHKITLDIQDEVETPLLKPLIEGSLEIPSDLGGSRRLDHIVRLNTEEDLSEVVEAEWSIDVFNSDKGIFERLWTLKTGKLALMKSLGRFTVESLPYNQVATSQDEQDLNIYTDVFETTPLTELELSSLSESEKYHYQVGIPLRDPYIVSYGTKHTLSLTLRNASGVEIGSFARLLDPYKSLSKYQGLERNDLFTNVIFKLPYLTQRPGDYKVTYLNRGYVEPINPSVSVLNPIGHSNSTLLKYGKKLADSTNITNIYCTNPYSLAESKNSDRDFNYIVFSSLDQLVDLIYSLSFASIPSIINNKLDNPDLNYYDAYSSNTIVRRPIEIKIGSEAYGPESYKAKSFSSFKLTKEDIKNALVEKGFTPTAFLENRENCIRRLSVFVYPTIGETLLYPLYLESFLVVFKAELGDMVKNGPDGYLNDVLELDKGMSWLNFDHQIGSDFYNKELHTFNSGKTLTELSGKTTYCDSITPASISYLPNYLKLFKSNFEFYGFIPFRLCTDRSLLGYKGEFVHRVEGYKKGQEVVHPVTGDLYLCIKDRPGIKSDLTVENYDTIEHNYPTDLPTYSVLEDSNYFIKMFTLNNEKSIQSEEVYKREYKSSLPTYLALLSYLNLLVNESDGLLFNPYTNTDLANVDRKKRIFTSDRHNKKLVVDNNVVDDNTTFFPYSFLEDYLRDMEKNEVIATELTPEAEYQNAKDDSKYGGWFKLKNLNYHNFIYMSSRPLLWVKDRDIIARSNLAHPRSNVIRVGNKFYYLRLVTDMFYPADDCCMESDVISGIPNQSLDFTSFNDPSIVNFKESLITPTIRNILWLASRTTSVTNRDVVYEFTPEEQEDLKTVILGSTDDSNLGKSIYSITLASSKKDVNYFARKGSLIYTASPNRFYLTSSDKSGRILDYLCNRSVNSTITYNIYDSVPDFEYGSDENLLGLNEIRFKDPLYCINFKSENNNACAIQGISYWNNESSTRVLTGISEEEPIYSYNADGSVVRYNTPDETTVKPFEEYYPVHVVLEHVEEKDLPVYNIKDSLFDLLGEQEFSVGNVIERLGNKINTNDKSYLLENMSSEIRDIVYPYSNLAPSHGVFGYNIPTINNGGYSLDVNVDIDYNIQSPLLKDLINYQALQGTTPDTQFNLDPKTVYEMQDRKTYGSINLLDVINGNWGSYKTIRTKTSDISRRCYDRWSMTGYLGTINFNHQIVDNILFPQLEKIVKHRLVNNDTVREKERQLYPLIHVFYFKTKLILIPSETPFDVTETDGSNFKNNKSLDYMFSGRTKPIDIMSKDVDRVKLGCNVFDVIVPYMFNDRYIKNNQELRRKIVPVNSYGKEE